jgi:hypothetical protein
MTRSVRARLLVNQMRRGRLHARSCRHVRVDGPYRPSGRNASPSGITRSTIMSPAQGSPGSRTEIRLSAPRTPVPSTAPTHRRRLADSTTSTGCAVIRAQIRSVAPPH